MLALRHRRKCNIFKIVNLWRKFRILKCPNTFSCHLNINVIFAAKIRMYLWNLIENRNLSKKNYIPLMFDKTITLTLYRLYSDFTLLSAQIMSWASLKLDLWSPLLPINHYTLQTLAVWLVMSDFSPYESHGWDFAMLAELHYRYYFP